MQFELDHIFVCVNLDAPEATEVVALGLTEGQSALHQGQGTANRCFLFHNAYLELIWVHDEADASSTLTKRTGLFERWKGRTGRTCPFGICLRPKRPSDPSRASGLPFAGWDYLPRYVSPSRPIHVGANCDRLTEPMLFFIESASRPDSWSRQPPLRHRLGVREITRLTWTRPTSTSLSPELQAVVDAGYLGVELGNTHALTICFDNEVMGLSASLLPHLPITLKW
jgi:Glyoxalase-like domain